MSLKPEYNQVARIKVFGIGGAGCNAVNRMVNDGVKGVEFYVCNTDLQSLNQSKCQNKILLGKNTTKGLGAGGSPEVGNKAAIESEDDIQQAMNGSDMVFIACGEGGGTGTGAAPVFAKVAHEMGALTVGVVTTPFDFEGRRRSDQASVGLEQLKQYTDSIIVVSNNKLLSIIGKIPMQDAFKEADMSDVIFNYNHGGRVYARTRNDSLHLEIKEDGIIYMPKNLDLSSYGLNELALNFEFEREDMGRYVVDVLCSDFPDTDTGDRILAADYFTKLMVCLSEGSVYRNMDELICHPGAGIFKRIASKSNYGPWLPVLFEKANPYTEGFVIKNGTLSFD